MEYGVSRIGDLPAGETRNNNKRIERQETVQRDILLEDRAISIARWVKEVYLVKVVVYLVKVVVYQQETTTEYMCLQVPRTRRRRRRQS